MNSFIQINVNEPVPYTHKDTCLDEVTSYLIRIVQKKGCKIEPLWQNKHLFETNDFFRPGPTTVIFSHNQSQGTPSECRWYKYPHDVQSTLGHQTVETRSDIPLPPPPEVSEEQDMTPPRSGSNSFVSENPCTRVLSSVLTTTLKRHGDFRRRVPVVQVEKVEDDRLRSEYRFRF